MVVGACTAPSAFELKALAPLQRALLIARHVLAVVAPKDIVQHAQQAISALQVPPHTKDQTSVLRLVAV